jgi:hypothetical protein
MGTADVQCARYAGTRGRGFKGSGKWDLAESRVACREAITQTQVPGHDDYRSSRVGKSKERTEQQIIYYAPQVTLSSVYSPPSRQFGGLCDLEHLLAECGERPPLHSDRVRDLRHRFTVLIEPTGWCFRSPSEGTSKAYRIAGGKSTWRGRFCRGTPRHALLLSCVSRTSAARQPRRWGAQR